MKKIIRIIIGIGMLIGLFIVCCYVQKKMRHTSIIDGVRVTLISERNQKTPPEDIKTVPFGTVFTDHMFLMEWTSEKGWHNARIEPYKPILFDLASVHMHYAAEIFEGMKAYKTINGETVLFRPYQNFERMNRSAKRMCMPEIDISFVLKALKLLVGCDNRWIPSDHGTSLYIRPTMIATEHTLNLTVPNKYLFFIIMSPVGFFYKDGFNPSSIMVSDTFTRSSIGGVGEAKTGGNYAASMMAQQEAKKNGHAQVLWLDPVERKYIEEVGSMNIFFVINNVLITPQLTGTILPGITRKSVIELAISLGITVEERRISIDEVIKAIEQKSCTEIFGTGTAAVIAPIGKIAYKNVDYIINENKTGKLTQKFFDKITGIQHGSEQDSFGWIDKVVLQ